MKALRRISGIITLLCMLSSTADATVSEPVIDMHCHLAGLGAGDSGSFIADRLRHSWKYRFYLKAFGVTEREILKKGDGFVLQRLSETLARSKSVAYAVVLAMDGVVGENGDLDKEKTEIYIPNDFVAAEVRKFPNLLFGASINPYRRDAIPQLEKAAREGAVLVKWLPPIQNIDPADQRLVPFYLKLKELELPLLTHTGNERSFTFSHDELGDPERLRLPLSLGVTVIAAHSACNGSNGGEQNLDRLARLASQYPNLYADISSLTQINRFGKLQKVLRTPELQGRLLYGTDMPLINMPVVTPVAFLFHLSLKQMITIARIDNPWDRDVSLKKALGVQDEIFTHRAASLKVQRYRSVNENKRSPK